MDISKTNGFFLNFYQNIRNSLKSEEIKNYTNLDSNEEKFKFVYKLSKVEEKLQLKKYDRDVKVDDYQLFKDLNSAIELKNVGNKLFQGDKYSDSLNFYNKSYLMTPGDCSKRSRKFRKRKCWKRNFYLFLAKEISVILANRSAALYHMNEFDAALVEIKRAENAGYPKDMLYKLSERKARCFLAKKNNEESLKAFQ
jgi:hypothetical protein